MRLKKFEAFGYVPDRKKIEEEMAKRVNTDTTLDKAGIFTYDEKEFLIQAGFEIKRNDKRPEEMVKGTFPSEYMEVAEIAETYDNKNNKIVIFKYSPKEKEYTYVKYCFVIIKDGKIVATKNEMCGIDCVKYGKDHVNRRKIEELKKLLDLIYFELMDWEEEEKKINKLKEDRKKIDPFGEEDWDK